MVKILLCLVLFSFVTGYVLLNCRNINKSQIFEIRISELFFKKRPLKGNHESIR